MNCTHAITVNAKALLAAAKYAADPKASTATYRYVYLDYDWTDQEVTMYATDSFRLITFKQEVMNTCESVVIPVDAALIRKNGKMGYQEATIYYDDTTGNVEVEFYKNKVMETSTQFTESIYYKTQEELKDWVEVMGKMLAKVNEQEREERPTARINVTYLYEMATMIKTIFGKSDMELTLNDGVKPLIFQAKDTVIGEFTGIVMPMLPR